MKYLTLILTILLSHLSYGQTIERQVIGSAGNVVEGSSASLSFTIGETVTASNSAVSVIVNSGFQQGESSPVLSVVDHKNENLNISVYPNPTRSIVHVEINTIQTALNQDCTFLLYDAEGRVVLSGELLETGGSLDMSAYASGTYFLMVEYGDHLVSERTRIIKL